MKTPTRSNLPALREASPARRKSSVAAWLGQRIRLTDVKFWSGFFGGEPWAGEPVTPSTAMQLSAVWRAVRLTAETIAALPLNFYTETPNGPQLVRGSDVDQLLRVSPNEEQTPQEFWECIVGCMELVGDGMARKRRLGRRVVALDPMDPLRVVTTRNVSGGIEHRYTDDRGHLQILSPADVFQLKGFSLGGLRGMSTVSYGMQSLSLARAAQKAQGKLFKSGLRSSGFINTGGVLDEPDRARLNKILEEYTGADKTGGIMLLEAGMEFKALSMSSQDAELLLTRKFEIEEIGRWFGMPPILLGHAVEGQTMWGSGVDSIITAWMTLGLYQRLHRITQAIAKRVMTPEERAQLYAKFNPDALLAVNSPARIAFLATAVQNGVLDRDEARALLERGKRPGGDVLTAQVNLAPLDQLGQSSAPDQARSALRAFLGIEDHAPADSPALQ